MHALRAVASSLKRLISFTLKPGCGPSLRAGTFFFLPSSSPLALRKLPLHTVDAFDAF